VLGGEIHALEQVFLLLLLFVVLFGTLARKLQAPYPIVLVIAGLLLSFIPGTPRSIILNPDAVFLLVLPPLLYATAWLTSWRDFTQNLFSILLLAFGLVGFTVLGVAVAAHFLFPGFDWRLGCVLGAIVAPTDAIAATAIAKRVGLPQRIVDILEGESLVNDASGLLALEFSLAMVVEGHTPTVWEGTTRLIFLLAVGVGIGLVVGALVHWIERRIDDAPVEITLSILTPFAAFLAAEYAHASGVLAVVACGLYLSRHGSEFLSANVRLQAKAVWESMTFIINGVVFVLIGLQLPRVLAGIRAHRIGSLLLYSALFSALVIVLRLLWTLPGGWLAHLVRNRMVLESHPRSPAKEIFVTGWTGMRGVVSLAAALSLPEALADGTQFPQRNLIVFLTFSVILVTLVVQGLTLAPLIRALGLAGHADDHADEEQARQIIANAALAHLEDARARGLPEFAEVYNDMAPRYSRRVSRLRQEKSATASMSTKEVDHYRAALAQILRVERNTLARLRKEGRIHEEVLRKIEHELDLREMHMALD